MKKVLLIVSALICGLTLTNCGGGSDSISSNVKENEYLGSFPKIHADYELAQAALMKEAEDEMSKHMSDYAKLQKISEKYEAREKKMEEQLEVDLAAERQKFVVKEVPFSCSESLNNSNDLFYDIISVKTSLDDDGEPVLVFNLKAKKDFTVPKYQNLDYTVYIRLIDKDKNTLEHNYGVVIPIATNLEVVRVKVGDIFPEQIRPISVMTSDIANFAGVEFISNDEYKTLIGL